MGFDWEGMLGTSGAGIQDAYEDAIERAEQQSVVRHRAEEPARQGSLHRAIQRTEHHAAEPQSSPATDDATALEGPEEPLVG